MRAWSQEQRGHLTFYYSTTNEKHSRDQKQANGFFPKSIFFGQWVEVMASTGLLEMEVSNNHLYPLALATQLFIECERTRVTRTM